MMDKAWSSKEEVPYSFARSSIKFDGHTGGIIDDLNPIWDYQADRSDQIPQICLLQGHKSNSKVTRLKIVDFDPNWQLPDCIFSLNFLMDLKWYTN